MIPSSPPAPPTWRCSMESKPATAMPKSCSRDALRIRKTKLGPDDLDVANSLSNMASLARRQAHYQEAEDAAKSALAIREKKLTADHPDIATALNVLAEIYRAEGQYALAEPLLNRALQIRKKAFGPDHTTVATTLNSLGSLYEGQGRVGRRKRLIRTRSPYGSGWRRIILT